MPIRRSPNGAGHTRPQPGRDHPEWVVAINRNDRSQSIGNSGRNPPVRALPSSSPRSPRLGEAIWWANMQIALLLIAKDLSEASPIRAAEIASASDLNRQD
jgi:hypothetical protein